MYKLLIEWPDNTETRISFDSFFERDDYINENWDDEAEWLIPCGPAWIDVRDIPHR